jgi:membrane protein
MKDRGAANPPPSAVESQQRKWRRRLDQARERGVQAADWARTHIPGTDIAEEALERERIGAAGLLAGGLAYRLFFWIVPLGLVFAAVLSFWVEADRVSLENAARNFGIGGAAASAAADAIESGSHSRWYFLVVGLALLTWFGAGVVRALSVAQAVAWRLRPERLERPLLAGAVFTGLMVGIVVLTTATAALRERTPGPGIGLTLALVVLYLVALVWASTRLPSRASDWREFVPGAIYVALGTQALHLVVVLYLAPKLGRSSELYGTLGASTVILLWLYLEARLVVGAAFLNAALWERRQTAARPRSS